MPTEKTDKCEQCKKTPATVHFASISSDGTASKAHLCTECGQKRIPRFPGTEKFAPVVHIKNVSATETVARLQEEMKKAIKEERYEDAAKLRDQISSPAQPPKKNTKKGDKQK